MWKFSPGKQFYVSDIFVKYASLGLLFRFIDYCLQKLSLDPFSPNIHGICRSLSSNTSKLGLEYFCNCRSNTRRYSAEKKRLNRQFGH